MEIHKRKHMSNETNMKFIFNG